MGCIDCRHQPLSCSFFITGCAVDLAGKKQAFDTFCLKVGIQFQRVDIVVFYGVPRAYNFCIFKSLDGVEHSQLCGKRETCW